MPKSYEINNGGPAQRKIYISFYKLDEHDNTTEALLYIDAISHLTDGSFKFGFGIILERQEKSFPKET